MPATAPYQIYPCGDHAVTIELGDTIDPLINQKVISLFQYLQANPITGVRDIIPAYHTVTIVYDLSVLQKTSSLSVYEMMRTHLQKAAERSSDAEKKSSRQISIPVCYDLSLAPDIASLAETHGLSIEEVIAIHTAKTYRVYMIGFLPGFAYMGTVDDTINTPRKTIPRINVPAGSVGIAGTQTGIYPFDSPGGWQLIGQTPVAMFDAQKEMPCYLQPGDEVKFHAIMIDEFRKIKNA